MYIMHNNDKYCMSKVAGNCINIVLDEYNEIYFVLENKDHMFGHIYINDNYCDLKIAHYYAKANNTIKYIDDETFIPIRKFIRSEFYCSYEIDGILELCFWNMFDMKPPINIRKITLFVLIHENDAQLATINIMHDNVKQYTFDDFIFIIAETSEFDLDNVYQKIASYMPFYFGDIWMYHYVEKN